MKKKIDIPEGYVRPSDAAQAVNCLRGTQKINRLLNYSNCIRYKRINSRNYVYLPDVIQYFSAHPEQTGRVSPVWGTIKNGVSTRTACYPLYGYDNEVFITEDGYIIDTTNHTLKTPTPWLILDKKTKELKPLGYYQVQLKKDGKLMTKKLHALVGKTQCDNALNKSEIHHIKPLQAEKSTIADNLKDNLIYVWDGQHSALHKLLKENKKEEYEQLINDIKKENSQKVFVVDNDDTTSDDSAVDFLFLTPQGYEAYKNNKPIQPGDIVIESAKKIEMD